MATATISERELAFLLYEVLDTAGLLRRERYAEHSREVFDATLETARQLAEDLLAPHLREGDENEPQFENGRARLVAPTRAAWQAIADAGFLSAHWGSTPKPAEISDGCQNRMNLSDACGHA